jgi:magnesium transporter
VKYPGIDTTAGFVVSTSIIVVTVLALYWMFKSKDWL